MKIIIKAKDFQHAAARMQVAGLRYRPDHDDGSPMKREHQLERCVTPDLVCTDGQIAFAVDIADERVDKIPTNDSPQFEVRWREDDLVDDGEGNMVQVEKPTFEVDMFDEFGVKTGTRQQLAGDIV
jgi:hypothetical protein